MTAEQEGRIAPTEAPAIGDPSAQTSEDHFAAKSKKRPHEGERESLTAHSLDRVERKK